MLDDIGISKNYGNFILAKLNASTEFCNIWKSYNFSKY